jgi:hypothetical protein
VVAKASGLGQPHHDKPSAGREQAPYLTQSLADLEVMQDRHHRHEIERACQLRQVTAVDRHVAESGTPRACLLTHPGIAIGANYVLEGWREDRQELSTPAADVQNSPALGRQVRHDPAVEMVIVAPRVPVIQSTHRLRCSASGHRPCQPPQRHAGILPNRR